jgi:hypothetical protein
MAKFFHMIDEYDNVIDENHNMTHDRWCNSNSMMPCQFTNVECLTR